MAFQWTELSRRAGDHGTVITESVATGEGTLVATTVFTANGSATSSMCFVPGEFEGPVVPPVIESLEPSSAALGSPSFTLHVKGTGFKEDSVILWNGSPEPTTFVSATELTTGVNMETVEVAMEIPVVVKNADAESEPATFTLTNGAASAARKVGRPRKDADEGRS
jgi:hypothetical protein